MMPFFFGKNKNFSGLERLLYRFVIKFDLLFAFCKGHVVARLWNSVFFGNGIVTVKELSKYYKFDAESYNYFVAEYGETNKTPINIMPYLLPGRGAISMIACKEFCLGFLYYFLQNYNFKSFSIVTKNEYELYVRNGYFVNQVGSDLAILLTVYDVDGLRDIVGFTEYVFYSGDIEIQKNKELHIIPTTNKEIYTFFL